MKLVQNPHRHATETPQARVASAARVCRRDQGWRWVGTSGSVRVRAVRPPCFPSMDYLSVSRGDTGGGAVWDTTPVSEGILVSPGFLHSDGWVSMYSFCSPAVRMTRIMQRASRHRIVRTTVLRFILQSLLMEAIPGFAQPLPSARRVRCM